MKARFVGGLSADLRLFLLDPLLALARAGGRHRGGAGGAPGWQRDC
ncbi:MAG: hypothetical protein ACR2IK_12050 [Chloroflexota bacterium]